MQHSTGEQLTNNWYQQFQKSEGLQQALSHHVSDNVDELAYFVYDLNALKSHLDVLQQQDTVKLWYAVKANPLSRIIQTVDQAGIQFDVASSGELQQVLDQNVSADRILNTGPAKSRAQLAEFLAKGVNTFVVESPNQLKWLNELAKEQSITPDVLLRVQLQWPDGDKNPLGGNQITPFGMSLDAWKNHHVSLYPHLNICGLHIFQWGNMLSNKKMYALWQQMIEPLVSLAKTLGMSLKVLDLGGGLGIDYHEQGVELHWSEIIADLAKIKQQANVAELWLELGRYAVANCGYYVTSVVDKKVNFDQQQLVLAAGINHLLRPGITDQPFPVRLLRDSSHKNTLFDLHGPLCTSMDKLGNLPLPTDVDIDDRLLFGYVGAYGFTESMPFFLCHQTAAEYVYCEQTLSLVRAAKPAQWYLA
ncbi:PLP-dependent decarboxylase [Thalassotalea sp. 1_MG-2023]|uniref:PLP-dependent decarboxylase n=1 Tax=Thalassotalea sp. 1_MG-2023 TaxID=3062680 RepID=UPI0026E174DA|nr:PLP-dependent decarboxylase [Thalassotalea sp. 1_MG-2023]MDO6427064.1 PLP-dependent decarboxylase [Thalassotalea sp. 1_MG-2023]